MICKWYSVNNIKVQGLGEKFVAEILTKNDIGWKRSTFVKLPDGRRYTPDIDVGNFYIEVKGLRTCLKALGILSLLEQGKMNWSGKIDTKDLDKILYVHKNVKPILIYINDNPNDKKYFEYWEDINKVFNENNITYIYGKDNFQKEFDSNFEILGDTLNLITKKQLRILNLFELPIFKSETITFDFKGRNGEIILNELNISKVTLIKWLNEAADLGIIEYTSIIIDKTKMYTIKLKGENIC